MNKIEVSNRIKKIRLSKGDTLEEFGIRIARVLNIPSNKAPSKSNVSKWEAGSSLPNTTRLKAIADIGEMTVNQLLHGDTNISVSLEKEVVKVLNDFLDSESDVFGQEVKLLKESGIEGLLRLVGMGKGRSDKAVVEYVERQERLKNLKDFGEKYIYDNYNNYTYEKYIKNYPDSDLQGFKEFKKIEKKKFRDVLNRYWLLDEIPNQYYYWINNRFTDQIIELLERIDNKAVKEDKRDYYINEVVQPFLDQAAEDFKEYIRENTDIE